MENIKQKKPRGRPTVKKLIENIEMKIQEQEQKPELEKIIDEHCHETDGFLDELNNVNFGKEFYQVSDNDDDDEEVENEVEEEEVHFLNQEPNELSYNLINKLNSQREEMLPTQPNIKPYKMEEDNDDIFSKKGTQILGETKLHLLSKITQYKQLFPKELKGFKVKKNCNEDELREYLNEIEVIVSINSVDKFITDSILQSIKMGEGLSSYTKYDITGLADILKANEHFHSLAKQLYIKYGCFSKMPVESQMAMLILTSSYICIQANKQKKMKFKANLNEPMII